MMSLNKVQWGTLDSQIISHLCGWDCNCYRHAVQALEYSGKKSFSRQVHNQFFLLESETSFFLTGPNWKICGSYPADLFVASHSGLYQLYWTITIKENKRLFLEPKIFSLENWSIDGKGLGWISFLVHGSGVCKKWFVVESRFLTVFGQEKRQQHPLNSIMKTRHLIFQYFH